MKHLALLGDGPHLLTLAGHLRRSGFAVTLLPEPPREGDRHHGLAGVRTAPGLALVGAEGVDQLERFASTAEGHGLPWLFLCGEATELESADLTTVAYRAGALAVLPEGASAELVVQTAGRTIESLRLARQPANPPRRIHYRAGDTIDLRADETLRVIEGVVAQVAWHEDGTEGLVGLWGPEHLLTGHPEDACFLSFRAQTEAWVEIDPLTPDGDAFERLLERTRRLEAWSSVQSRQSMQQRLLGVLALLAEQFGEPCVEGTRIDVRITHAQLASAIGATRATVTRLLGPLRRRGLVQTVTVDEGERFCLPRTGRDRKDRDQTAPDRTDQDPTGRSKSGNSRSGRAGSPTENPTTTAPLSRF